jgi:protein-disulfide isomerase
MKRYIALTLSRGLALSAAALCCMHTATAEITEKDFDASMSKFLQSDAGVKKIGEALDKYFRQKQQDAFKQQEEQQKADLEAQFKNPVKVDVGAAPVKGNANAKITIIEFSDFQCPFCKRGRDTMDEVLKAYPNDVKIAFKHYPLPFHDKAMPASRASWAAQRQGKFWEFYKALFDNQDKLTEEFYLETAKGLGLNIDKFKADMASAESEAAVKADMELAQKNGIQGTPGFFVNGIAVKGAYPVEHFKTIIDRLLGKAKA